MMKSLILILLTMALAGCTWVKLTPEGEKARVLSAAEVKSCTKLGKTVVSVRAVVAGIHRDADTVKKELEKLARNHANDLKGDTVVPEGKIENGQQTFSVYRCINP